LEADGSGEADEAVEGDDGLGELDGAAGEDVVAAGEPEGEVSAGGVSGGDDAGEVERVGSGEGGDVVVGLGDVREGVGPAAVGGSDAAVLDGPDGYTLGAEGGAEVAAIAEVVLGLPPAAVEEDNEGRFAVLRREPEVAELRFAGAVGDAVVGDGWFAVEEVHRW